VSKQPASEHPASEQPASEQPASEQPASARMSLPICALAGSPLMFFYTLSVLLAPLVLAQYLRSFHPRDALHRPGESAPWAP
jgi:hypothetical protein